jgi:hypothetical protein
MYSFEINIHIDVFVSQKMSNQIWNLEYIDLAHLLYKNCVSNIDKPKKVLGIDEDGDILIERSKKASPFLICGTGCTTWGARSICGGGAFSL